MQKSLSSGVQETDDRPLLLTSRETAACLRISERTLWTLTDRGDIQCIRMGAAKRYPTSELERFVASQLLDQNKPAANPYVDVSANQNRAPNPIR